MWLILSAPYLRGVSFIILAQDQPAAAAIRSYLRIRDPSLMELLLRRKGLEEDLRRVAGVQHVVSVVSPNLRNNYNLLNWYVVAQPRKALVMWCRQECFLVDGQGFVFKKIDAQKNASLPRIEDPSSADLSSAQSLEDELAFITIKKALAGLGELSPRRITLLENEPVYRFYFDEGWYAIFDAIEDPALQAKKLLEFLKAEFPDRASRSAIEYLDVRIGERVYLKRRGQ